MDKESFQIRFLIFIALLLCAVMIGYNLFYSPDITMVVYQDDSSVAIMESGSESSNTYSESSQTSDLSSFTSKAIEKKPVNINTATLEELDENLPGVGPTLAQRIIDYRLQNGPFQIPEDIKNVSGIGEKSFEELRGYILLE